MGALKVGITGGIGAGKSVVSRIFEHLGYPVFNSDIEAKKLMKEDPELKKGIIDLFGEEAYVNGDVNRKHLSSIVFNDKNKIAELNQLVHPKVRAAFAERANTSKSPFIFNEAAILYETGAYQNFDVIILVSASEKVRIERTTKRDNTSVEEVKARINHQMSDDEKRKFHPYEVNNNGDELVLPQILEFIRSYSTSS